MMTVYVNREVDGYLDLYVTNGTVYKTGAGAYDYNSTGGFKMLLETFREDKDALLPAEQRAVLSAKDWLFKYGIAKIPVEYGNETVLAYEATPEEEKTVKTKQHRS